MLWRKPSWGRLALFVALIFSVYAALVWISSGFYLSAAEAPLDQRWNAILLQALLWSGGFAALGGVIMWLKRVPRT